MSPIKSTLLASFSTEVTVAYLRTIQLMMRLSFLSILLFKMVRQHLTLTRALTQGDYKLERLAIMTHRSRLNHIYKAMKSRLIVLLETHP